MLVPLGGNDWVPAARMTTVALTLTIHSSGLPDKERDAVPLDTPIQFQRFFIPYFAPGDKADSRGQVVYRSVQTFNRSGAQFSHGKDYYVWLLRMCNGHSNGWTLRSGHEQWNRYLESGNGDPTIGTVMEDYWKPIKNCTTIWLLYSGKRQITVSIDPTAPTTVAPRVFDMDVTGYEVPSNLDETD